MNWLNEKLDQDPDVRRMADEILNEMRIEQDLAALRQARGISQAELANRLGVSQPYVAKLESGRVKDVELRTVVRYATALGARVNFRIEDIDARRLSGNEMVKRLLKSSRRK